MRSAMQVAKPIPAVHGHRQCGKEPNYQHAVRMMMTEVLQAVEILGFVESLVFNLQRLLAMPNKAWESTSWMENSVSQ